MVSERPDGVICDLDGVIYRGQEPIPGSAAAIERLRSSGTRFLFCTNNSSLTVDGYRDKLAGLGIRAEAEEILTSATTLGEVLRAEMPEGASVFRIGGAGLQAAIAAAGLREVRDRGADVVAIGWDDGFDYAALRTATLALADGAAFYATNSDATLPTPEGPWPGAGALLAAVSAAAGRTATVVGKPYEPMVRVAAERLRGCARVMVVGDRLDTDIAFGVEGGWTTTLVLSGVTRLEDVTDAKLVPDEIAATLADASWAQ